MNAKRKQVQDLILKYVGLIVSGPENVKLYEDLFASMNDQEFDKFMHRIKDGTAHISVVVPNDGKTRVTVENNFKVGKMLGYDFFQRVKVLNHPDYPDHMLPNKMLTMVLPIRRAQQLLNKKISIPEHNNDIDPLTGQVRGASKAAKLTYPEQQIMLTMNLDKSALELAKIRGGDQYASKKLNDDLFKDGTATQEQVNQYSTKPTSTQTLKRYLEGMHIRSTLGEIVN